MDRKVMPLPPIPQRELIVWENEQLRASLARGIADVRAGNVTDLDLSTLDVDPAAGEVTP